MYLRRPKNFIPLSFENSKKHEIFGPQNILEIESFACYQKVYNENGTLNQPESDEGEGAWVTDGEVTADTLPLLDFLL